MELVSIYLYSRVPMQTNDINARSFHNLKMNGWFTDTRSSVAFIMLNKRIECDGQWYRALVRFKEDKDKPFSSSYSLSTPCPFIITECEMIVNDNTRWKDTKTYHGPKLKGVQGF